MILRISSSSKSKETSLDWVKDFWWMGSTFFSFKGVHCSAKKLLKKFAFVFTSVKTCYLPKEEKLVGFSGSSLQNRLLIGFFLQQRII